MTEKRFEMVRWDDGQAYIIDHIESKEKEALVCYNDLGRLPFTSAGSVCNLLNELHDENQLLKKHFNSIGEPNFVEKVLGWLLPTMLLCIIILTPIVLVLYYLGVI